MGNFLTRFHAEDDSLLNALQKDGPAGEPNEHTRPGRKKALLEHMAWIPQVLRKEVLVVGNSRLFER